MKIVIGFLFALFLVNVINAEGKYKLKKQYQYAAKCIDHFEGFSKSIGENDFSYHSLRMDVSDALLTRCTDGNMAIEWLTQKVDNKNKNGNWFTWIAAVDMRGKGQRFDVYINDVKRFELIASNEQERIFRNEEGGILEFTTIELDQHNDAHGYMSLFAPASWITLGEPLKIKIIGEAAGSNTWIIVYKAGDVISHLQNLAKYETWLNVKLKYDGRNSHFNFTAPSVYDQRILKAKIGSNNFSFILELDGEEAVGAKVIENIDARNLSFNLKDENSELISFNDLSEASTKQKLLKESLLINNIIIADDVTIINCQRIYKPHTVKNLLELSNSKLSKGKLYLMNSSHQDIAWMDSPEKCVIERDTMLLTPLYDKAMNADSTYRFDVEDALMLKEFTARHPERKAGISRLLKEGKITCGASFIQPYEEMYSGEALVRQFYFGRKWLKDEFNFDSKVYWNVDVPGRVLQMPQILKKSGVEYMVISRFEKGIYNWYSPDRSYVTAYSPGHYADAFTPLHKNVYDAANYLAESSIFWEQYYADNSTENGVPVLSSWDMSPAVDYSNVIKNWESINELQIGNEEKISIELPKFEIQTVQGFLDRFVNAASNIPEIKGERPPVWLYIHGPSHYQAVKASREADILLTVAEKFSTIDALTDNSFSNYPAYRLSMAWESKIYPDHGWGGKEGEITDNLFLSKYVFARSEASQIIETATNSIASKVKTSSNKGLPVLVFNSLNWIRTDNIDLELVFEKGHYRNIELIDHEGNQIEFQLSDISGYDDGTLKKIKLSFIAQEIPSIGYKTFYVKDTDQLNDEKIFDPHESDHYRISFTNGGIESIYDKELRKEILDISQYKGGEVFTMKSEGNGAGEFADIQQPTMEGFDKTGNYETDWIILENGPVYSVFKSRQQIRNAVVEQKIKLFKKLKRIDFNIALLNWEGVLYREYRMALPINMKNGQVSYETPFGVVDVGKDEIEGAAGERYRTECRDIHPRGVENWLGANNDEFGVTLSSCVAVADYIDPTNKNSENALLQPILLASRKSCHGLGNEYLQTGDHHYYFSLTSHPPGWKNGFTSARQANEKLITVVNPKQYKNAALPEEKSFFSVNKDNVVVSTIKKAEDDNSVIIRFYELFGQDEKIEIKSYSDLQDAFRTNLIEEEKEKLMVNTSSVSLDLGKFSIETIKLITSP